MFVFLLLGLVYLIRETLFIFAVPLLFAYLLRPLVNYLDQRLPGVSRVPALAIVYLCLVGLLFVIGIEIGSRVVLEANALATRVPELLSKLEEPGEPIFAPPLQTVKATVVSTLRKQLAYHSRDLLSLLPNAAWASCCMPEVLLSSSWCRSWLFLLERWPGDSQLQAGNPCR